VTSAAAARGRDVFRTRAVEIRGANPRAARWDAASRAWRAKAEPTLPRPSRPIRQVAGLHPAAVSAATAALAAASSTVVVTTNLPWDSPRDTRVDVPLLIDESFGPSLRRRPRFHLSR